MTSKSVIIVGNGLFGSIAATLARGRGHHVTVVSNLESMAASRASGCVLAPSWLSSLSPAQVETGLSVLRGLYAVHDVTFTLNRMGTFKAQRIDPDAVLLNPDLVADVEKVKDGAVVLTDGTVLKGQVLVAAGVWSESLVEMPKMRGLYGSSFRYQAQMPTPRLHVYQPYRQAVAFQLNSKEVWAGDGTALIRKTWEPERDARIAASASRYKELFGLEGKHKIHVGIRPYVEGFKSGYFDRPFPRTWVSTGGAKNGTVLAAAQAARFIEESKL